MRKVAGDPGSYSGRSGRCIVVVIMHFFIEFGQRSSYFSVSACLLLFFAIAVDGKSDGGQHGQSHREDKRRIPPAAAEHADQDVPMMSAWQANLDETA